MKHAIRRTGMILIFAMMLMSAVSWAQPPPMNAPGCCCLAYAGTYACTDKTQGDCLKIQPSAPMYPKIADWKKAWNDAVAASKAQEAKPMRGGWIAESCEKSEARMGCCCFPKRNPTDKTADCKASSEFDCSADCSLLKDGRLPSGCTWTVGDCSQP